MSDNNTSPAPAASPVSDKPRSILKLPLKDISALHANYMPFIKHGGIFVPTKEENHRLGDEVIVAMHLLSTDKKLAIPGKVVWMSPKTGDNGTPGVGIQFTGNTKAKVKLVIQTMLGNRANIPSLNRVY